MIDIIGFFDNQDETLGLFFNLCYEDLNIFLYDSSLNISYYDSPKINEVAVAIITEPLEKFILLAYSHGGENELVKNGNIPYISTKINIDKFKNTLFYTCSCHTGKVLGEELINNGALSYIGYKDKFEVWGFNMNPYIECANYGMKLFFKNTSTDNIIPLMKSKYNEHIDNYENDIFGAAMLVANRNGLVQKGNNISIEDLN